MEPDRHIIEPAKAGLALHACCGPCLIEPFDAFAAEGFDVTVVYFNPNIHPAEEYRRRLDTLREYADRHGIRVVELAYDPDRWNAAVAGAGSREERCRRCYELRLGAVADWAATQGVGAFGTTLTVSPYQDAGAIAAEGRRHAARTGVRYEHRDFRERYREATRRSRDEGMYRQNYCGCAPSEREAEADRERRRAERRRLKESGARP